MFVMKIIMIIRQIMNEWNLESKRMFFFMFLTKTQGGKKVEEIFWKIKNEKRKRKWMIANKYV